MKYDNNFIDADDTHFYFHSDQEAPNGKVMVAEISKPGRQNWKDLVGEQQKYYLQVLPAVTFLHLFKGRNILCCAI
jgi:protease II